MSQSAHREVSCSFCLQDSTQIRLRLLQGREANICVECIVRLSASTVDNASCAFCRRDNTQVERLFNGLEANICEKCLSECIDVCNDVLARRPDGSIDFAMEDVKSGETHEQSKSGGSQGQPPQTRGGGPREQTETGTARSQTKNEQGPLGEPPSPEEM